MDLPQTAPPVADHLADAHNKMAIGAAPTPGGAFTLYETSDLHGWHGFYRRKLQEERAVLREAAMNHLRTRQTVDAIDHELTRRHLAGLKKES